MHRGAEKRKRENGDGIQLAAASNSAQQVVNGREVSSSLQSEQPVRIQGFKIVDHWLTLPLDHFSASQDGQSIQIFAREVVAAKKVLAAQPYLCFFQGGPGFESPAPSESSTWLTTAAKHFRVVLLDMRGTGNSAPLRASTLAQVGDVDAQAAYLRHFRADSIVEDAELLRRALTARAADGADTRWSILGQSFGGFCCVSYLSKHPDGLMEAFLTGGLPPYIDDPCPATKVYQATFRRVIVQNKKFYSRFPQDVQAPKDIVNYLSAQPNGGIQTPAGNMLRPRTLQLLGLSCLGGGGAGGGFERLHFMLAHALQRFGAEQELSPQFLHAFDAAMPFDTNPLYAVMHETCYSQGGASEWAAQSVRDKHFAELFDAEAAARTDSQPVFFTGEMVFPWMFDDLASLRPLKQLAQKVAELKGWSKLYDSDALGNIQVPVAAATYCEDMYVDFNLAQDTAAKIAGLRQWMTNEFQHSGLRDSGDTIFEELLSMTRGSKVLF